MNWALVYKLGNLTRRLGRSDYLPPALAIRVVDAGFWLCDLADDHAERRARQEARKRARTEAPRVEPQWHITRERSR